MTSDEEKDYRNKLRLLKSPIASGTVEQGEGPIFLRGFNAGVEAAEKFLPKREGQHG